ncbi:MAG: hypothetical protein JNL98_07760 [Bryobacterales bacterium]|nr:hypothetical protein [Bryobacterales bacterium]
MPFLLHAGRVGVLAILGALPALSLIIDGNLGSGPITTGGYTFDTNGRAMRFTTSASGFTDIEVTVALTRGIGIEAGAQYWVQIYSDNSGGVGTLLGQALATPTQEFMDVFNGGWAALPIVNIPSLTLSANTNYWVGLTAVSSGGVWFIASPLETRPTQVFLGFGWFGTGGNASAFEVRGTPVADVPEPATWVAGVLGLSVVMRKVTGRR